QIRADAVARPVVSRSKTQNTASSSRGECASASATAAPRHARRASPSTSGPSSDRATASLVVPSAKSSRAASAAGTRPPRSSTSSPVSSIFSSFCAMVASFPHLVGGGGGHVRVRLPKSRDLGDQADVRGLRALLALLLLVLDLRALGKRPVAAPLDRAEVHEQTRA